MASASAPATAPANVGAAAAERNGKLLLMWKLLQTFAFIAAGFVCLCFPFQLAFHGPVCIQGERRIWAWLYMACDVPLWLVSFALCLRALQDALRHRGPACIETLLRLIFNVLSLLCCLPWDGIAQISRNGAMQTGNYCFSYGHLSRCFFATRVITVLTRAINDTLPGLGAPRATMSFVLLVLHTILPLHWYACLVRRPYARSTRAVSPPQLMAGAYH
jgi:hypothetical protein